MPAQMRPAAREVDLLVVGGLTVDILPAGERRPGGSVLHATRAAADAGLRVGVLTASGPEAAAREGLAELRRRAVVHAVAIPETITFRHELRSGVRNLVLAAAGSALPVTTGAFRARAILYAPVAGELDLTERDPDPPDAVTGAILQGWLRRIAVGRSVGSGSPADLAPALIARLARCALLCVSREDLGGRAAPAGGLLDELRDRIGPRPVMALTDGANGAWIDAKGAREVVPAPEIVPGMALGAGDAYAAILLTQLAAGDSAPDAARAAAGEVVRFLRRHPA